MTLLNYQMLEFDYSLIASAALFLACQTHKHIVDYNKLLENRKYIDIHTQQDLEKCVNKIKSTWTMINTTAFSNFLAIDNKYQIRHNLNGKNLVIPSFSLHEIQSWLYTKKK